MPTKTTTNGYRHTPHGWIRVGEFVHVDPPERKPGHKGAFIGVVTRIVLTDEVDGDPTRKDVAEVHLCVKYAETSNGFKIHDRAGQARVVTPDCLTRTTQDREWPT